MKFISLKLLLIEKVLDYLEVINYFQIRGLWYGPNKKTNKKYIFKSVKSLASGKANVQFRFPDSPEFEKFPDIWTGRDATFIFLDNCCKEPFNTYVEEGVKKCLFLSTHRV